MLANSAALQDSTLIPGGVAFSSAVTSHAFILGGLSGAANLALTDQAGNSVALTIGNNNVSNAYSGVLSGGGSLIMSGSGTTTLSGNDTYTGNTIVNGGTLALTGNYAGAAAGQIFVNNTSPGTATLNIQGNLPLGTTQIYVAGVPGGTGVVNQSAGLVSFSTGAGGLLIGNAGGGANGTYNLSGGTVNAQLSAMRGVMLGVNSGSAGNPIIANFNLSNNGYLSTSMLAVGRDDTALPRVIRTTRTTRPAARP